MSDYPTTKGVREEPDTSTESPRRLTWQGTRESCVFFRPTKATGRWDVTSPTVIPKVVAAEPPSPTRCCCPAARDAGTITSNCTGLDRCKAYICCRSSRECTHEDGKKLPDVALDNPTTISTIMRVDKHTCLKRDLYGTRLENPKAQNEQQQHRQRFQKPKLTPKPNTTNARPRKSVPETTKAKSTLMKSKLETTRRSVRSSFSIVVSETTSLRPPSATVP